MSRWIDVDAFVEDARMVGLDTAEKVFFALVHQPSIDIVRCKECKHSKPTKYANGNLHCSWHYRSNMPDDFCSYGQKGDENVEAD